MTALSQGCAQLLGGDDRRRRQGEHDGTTPGCDLCRHRYSRRSIWNAEDGDDDLFDPLRLVHEAEVSLVAKWLRFRGDGAYH
jgi:hypothetical protein